MIVAPTEEIGNKLIKGISGQVDGSIIPGMLGMEAGQSAFGDIYAWFKNLLMWPFKNMLSEDYEGLIERIDSNLINILSLEAAKLSDLNSGVIAIDWFNGRRTPDVNSYLKGGITGLTLGSNAPQLFKALVEATAFGSKKIIDRFIEEGIPVHGVIALGGVAKRSQFVMQTLSDILNMPIKVARSENACALGAAMFASVIAGIHIDVKEAQSIIGSGFSVEYLPNRENVKKFEELYILYKGFCDFNENLSKSISSC
jgi:L-ribulokinase